MDARKRKRLETRGWRIGSSAKFLGLSDSEAALVEMKISMGEFVRARRVRAGLTQGDLAKLLQSSQSRVAKLEASDPGVSLDLLVRAAFAVGARRSEVAKALASA